MFDIVVSPAGYHPEKSGTLSTVLYVDADGYRFPEDEWTDMTLSVLSMWTETIVHNIGKAKASYSLPFMEGAYSIGVTQNGDVLTLEGREYDEKKFSASCDVKSFLEELGKGFAVIERIVLDTEENDPMFFAEHGDGLMKTVGHYKKVISNSLKV